MNLLPILGGAGSDNTGQSTSTSQGTEQSSQTQDSNPTPATAEPSDTAPPAATTGTGETTTESATQPTDQQSQIAKIGQSETAPSGAQAQSVIEAQLGEQTTAAAEPLDADAIEANARRQALEAQQQQRIEMLLEAVAAPAKAQQLVPAAAAEQAEVGSTESADGIPV